jgi:hypothetical protein
MIEARSRGEKGNERCAGLLAEEDDLSERERIRVSDRELRGSSAYLREAPGGAAVQPQLRRTTGLANDFDITPKNSLRVAGAERFHGGLFGGEPAREMNRWIVPPHTVGDFRFREDAVGEPVAVPFDRRSDARDICRVQAQSDDGHAPTA